MARLKVAFVGKCLGRGGADIGMLALARHWRAIQCTDIVSETPIDIVDLEELWPHIPRGIRIWAPKAIGHRVSRYKDLVAHCEWLSSRVDVMIFWHVDGIRGETADWPVLQVEWLQNSDPDTLRAAELREHTNFTVACTRHILGLLPEHRRKSSRFIPNPALIERATPRMGAPNFLKLLGLPPREEVNYLLFLGRLVPEKHGDVMVDILSQLPSNWHLLIVGRGMLGDQIFQRAPIVAPGRITMIDWVHHPGDLWDCAACFCLLSDFEGMPVAVLEAMAAGVPAVVTHLPYVDDLMALAGGADICFPVPQQFTAQQVVNEILRTQETDVEIRLHSAHLLALKVLAATRVAAEWEHLLIDAYKSWITVRPWFVRHHTPRQRVPITRAPVVSGPRIGPGKLNDANASGKH